MTSIPVFRRVRSLFASAASVPLHPERYRSDIDGLRALAVLAVVLFHAGIPGFAGGYVGVDMFFVISGYLITGIVRSDQAQGGFSYLKFYERRVRRILPALYTVMVVYGVLAFAILVPQDLEEFSRSAIAAALFVSNIFFWNGTGYFAAADQTKPLLHTWSLAVEEQFYLLYPPLIVFCSKRAAPYLIPILLLLFALSLFDSIWGNAHFWTAAFFLSPSRGWELLIGCLLTFVPANLPLGRPTREALALAGLACIALPVMLLPADSQIAVVAIALPCLGVAFLLFVNTAASTFAGRLLSLRPVVWFGLISYSLYLWHWPVFVFARQLLLRPLTIVEACGLIALSVILGALSWRFVERPFRGAGGKFTRRTLFAAAGAATLVLVAVSTVVFLAKGFPQRFSADIVAMLKYESYNAKPDYRDGTCFVDSAVDYAAEQCFRPTPGMRNVLVWGDSHAAHYFYGVEAYGRQRKFAVSEASLSGCVPLVGHASFLLHQCEVFDRRILDMIGRNHPDLVILSGHWNKYYQRDAAALFAAIDRTAATLSDRHVRFVIVGPGIEYSDRLPILITRAWARNRRAPLDLGSQLAPGIFDLDRILRLHLSRFSGAPYISVLTSICPRRRCPELVADGVPIVFDTAHLTAAGSLYIVRRAFGGVL